VKNFAVESSEKRKCIVCAHKTGRSEVWGYTDGIEISVPVCKNCKDRVGWCIKLAMDAHLKSICQTVRMSQVITETRKELLKM